MITYQEEQGSIPSTSTQSHDNFFLIYLKLIYGILGLLFASRPTPNMRTDFSKESVLRETKGTRRQFRQIIIQSWPNGSSFDTAYITYQEVQGSISSRSTQSQDNMLHILLIIN